MSDILFVLSDQITNVFPNTYNYYWPLLRRFTNLVLMAFLKSFEEYKSINGEMMTKTTSKAKALINALNVMVSPLVPSNVSTLT